MVLHCSLCCCLGSGMSAAACAAHPDLQVQNGMPIADSRWCQNSCRLDKLSIIKTTWHLSCRSIFRSMGSTTRAFWTAQDPTVSDCSWQWADLVGLQSAHWQRAIPLKFTC